MSKYYEHLNILLPPLLLPLLVRREAEAEEDEAEEPGHLFSESTPLADNYFRCVTYLLDTNSLSLTDWLLIINITLRTTDRDNWRENNLLYK